MDAAAGVYLITYLVVEKEMVDVDGTCISVSEL